MSELAELLGLINNIPTQDLPPGITPEQYGRFERDTYAELLSKFGPGGPLTDEYLRGLTDSPPDHYGAAGHNARNDDEVRPEKPYVNV